MSWYRKSARDLPWRRTSDPYRIWVSEIMLQQTQVDTVIPYYLRFLERFPDMRALAAASIEEVLKLWENLGYYSRARNLHAAADVMVKQHGARFPEDLKDALKLPGIGSYTAGAILSIACGQRLAAIDGNVKRVMARLYALEDPPAEKETARRIAALLDELIPVRSPGDFNQALMDLGATICLPAGPKCPGCPVSRHCRAFLAGTQDRIPAVIKKKPIPHRHAVAALIRDKKGRLLIVQRPHQGLLAGLWKLPGGFQQPGDEDLFATLERTVREETGLSLATAEESATVDHTFTHFRMTLHGFTCQRVSGKVHFPEGMMPEWIEPSQIEDFAFAKADRVLLRNMLGHHA